MAGSSMANIEAKLAELGVVLPSAAAPAANYVPFVVAGDLLFISGQICFGPDGTIGEAHTGKVGASVSPQAATAAARLCAIGVLAQAKAALGDLGRIRRCVRLGGFINADPGFHALPAVMNGASDFMVDVLGEAGRHARSTVGVAVLPMNCAVEVEAIFQIA